MDDPILQSDLLRKSLVISSLCLASRPGLHRQQLSIQNYTLCRHNNTPYIDVTESATPSRLPIDSGNEELAQAQQSTATWQQRERAAKCALKA